MAQPIACCHVHALAEPGAHSNVKVANSESLARLQLRCCDHPALSVYGLLPLSGGRRSLTSWLTTSATYNRRFGIS